VLTALDQHFLKINSGLIEVAVSEPLLVVAVAPLDSISFRIAFPTDNFASHSDSTLWIFKRVRPIPLAAGRSGERTTVGTQNESGDRR